jgi:hypothetical protein
MGLDPKAADKLCRESVVARVCTLIFLSMYIYTSRLPQGTWVAHCESRRSKHLGSIRPSIIDGHGGSFEPWGVPAHYFHRLQYQIRYLSLYLCKQQPASPQDPLSKNSRGSN